MRFGLDARLAFYDRGGIGRYIHCLAAAMAQECAADSFSPIVDFRDGGWPIGTWLVIGPVRSTRLDWLFGLQTAALGLDLMHYPDHVVPRWGPGRSVVTVHDVSFWRMPETHSAASLAYYERCRDSVRRAEAVICVSEFTRDELLAATDVRPEKVFTVPNGVEARFVPASEGDVAQVRGRYGLERPYVLFVGTVGSRKNLVRLVEAFAGSRELRGVELVLAGGPGDATKAVRQAIADCEVEERVRLLGPVRDEDLPALISAAVALAMPSLYEGFGLPVLEAMACGTAVVISDRRPLVDLAVGAAITVEPTEVESIRAGLERGVRDAGSRRMNEQRGRELARSYEWRMVARKTLEIYRQVAG